MGFLFTPAAQRAISAASRWSCDGNDGLGAAELLMGLLEENQCRAASMLAAAGIDASAVQQAWRQLQPVRATSDQDKSLNARQPGLSFSSELEAALDAVDERLAHFPRPLEFSTEQMLLALAAGQNEMSRWLAERGMSADRIEAQIEEIYGYVDSPLEIDLDALGAPSSAVPMPDERPSQSRADVSCTQFAGELSVLRILDAAANRAREGLRVVEDYARFVLDDRLLTGEAKQLRHDLAAALGAFPMSELLAARDTAGDVGTSITAQAERERGGLDELLTANCKRLEESLRSLEEYGKLLDPEASAAIKQLRYRSYTLERMLGSVAASVQRLAAARLYVLIDGCRDLDEFRSLVQSLVGAGVHVLQLRDKQLNDRQLLERARLLRKLTASSGTLCIINDRADIAALADADGLHVGQDELSVQQARNLVGAAALVGVSTHSIEQVRQAVRDGASYIGVGPTFPSSTKTFTHFPGLPLLREAAVETALPAFAIGGIGVENIEQVLATGIRRVAVGSAVTRADNPAAAAAGLLERLRVELRPS